MIDQVLPLSTCLWIFGTVLLVSVSGLAGGLLPSAFVQKRIAALLAFASGTLMAVALLDLLPEALERASQAEFFTPVFTHSPYTDIMIAVLFGFVAFYVIESFLGSHASGQSGHKHDTVGPLILVGDAVHNAADGVAIAAAFAVDVHVGIGTAIAVIVHELPQEISDYAILVSHGYSRKKALLSLVAVQLFAMVGALATIVAYQFAEAAAVYMMALSAGGFIYIASADLLPELHRRKSGAPLLKLAAFGAGVGVIIFLHSFFSH